jgi:hypothetical protein
MVKPEEVAQTVLFEAENTAMTVSVIVGRLRIPDGCERMKIPVHHVTKRIR